MSLGKSAQQLWWEEREKKKSTSTQREIYEYNFEVTTS
jgi:hypothetical protein